MKNILLFFCLLFAALPFANAQSGSSGAPPAGQSGETNNANPVREMTEKLAQKYNLNAKQVSRMYVIQKRKVNILEEIAPFKTSNPSLYYNKIQSAQKGTLASIRRMLTTVEQQDIFQKSQAEQRRLRAEKRREMLAQGASSLEIEAALAEIYIE